MLDKQSKIYVAGHNGLVVSAIWNDLQQRGYTNLVGRDINLLPSYIRHQIILSPVTLHIGDEQRE